MGGGGGLRAVLPSSRADRQRQAERIRCGVRFERWSAFVECHSAIRSTPSIHELQSGPTRTRTEPSGPAVGVVRMNKRLRNTSQCK